MTDKHTIRCRSNKHKAVEYKGGKCARCGNGELPDCCYDFHHIDPTTKIFDINIGILCFRKISIEQLLQEVDKCILLCHSCHSRKTNTGRMNKCKK